MKIAVDHQSALGRRTGIGSVTVNLFEAMAKEKHGIEFLFYNSGREDLSTPRRVLWESVQIPLKSLRDRPDLVYVPGFAPAILSPVRQVVLVHDLIGLSLNSNQRGPARFYWSRWLPMTLRRAHRLVANSETTRRDLERFLKIDPSRVRVIPFSINPCFRKLTAGDTMKAVLSLGESAARPFILAVGSLEPRKNHIRLLQAYDLLLQRGEPGFDLVIVGKPAGAEQEIGQFMKERSLGSRVRLMGYVGEEDLVALYNTSLGYVTTSLYEGFGLPALEAMSCGKSGIVSDRSSLPEVVGNTALLVNPDDTEAIADALKTYAGDTALRRRLESAAYERAQRHAPSAMARAMIEVFHEAAA